MADIEFEHWLDEQAMDLALNDCQMWGNLPESAKWAYRNLAADEWACPTCGAIGPNESCIEAGRLIDDHTDRP